MFVLIGIILLIIAIAFVPISNRLVALENKCGFENIDKARKAKKVNEILKIISSLIAMIAVAILLFSLIYSNEECKTKTYEYRVVDSTDIFALKDNISQEGTYYLGSGSLNNKTYYCYYEHTDEGYRYSKISPEDYTVYINYCADDETPHIDTLCKNKITTINNEEYWLVSLKGFFNREDYTVGTVINEKEYPLFVEYKIYVPEGSIIQNYEINLE